mmetsp:Transcript_65413/g.147577  ORF Transcript_65413/g.147577 Transcript_65413/m.147577 type:complete len:268 (+) Transcript_65413:827-1630(+)
MEKGHGVLEERAVHGLQRGLEAQHDRNHVLHQLLSGHLGEESSLGDLEPLLCGRRRVAVGGGGGDFLLAHLGPGPAAPPHHQQVRAAQGRQGLAEHQSAQGPTLSAARSSRFGGAPGLGGALGRRLAHVDGPLGAGVEHRVGEEGSGLDLVLVAQLGADEVQDGVPHLGVVAPVAAGGVPVDSVTARAVAAVVERGLEPRVVLEAVGDEAELEHGLGPKEVCLLLAQRARQKEAGHLPHLRVTVHRAEQEPVQEQTAPLEKVLKQKL